MTYLLSVNAVLKKWTVQPGETDLLPAASKNNRQKNVTGLFITTLKITVKLQTVLTLPIAVLIPHAREGLVILIQIKEPAMTILTVYGAAVPKMERVEPLVTNILQLHYAPGARFINIYGRRKLTGASNSHLICKNYVQDSLK